MLTAKNNYKRLLEEDWSDNPQEKEKLIKELLGSQGVSPKDLLKDWQKSALPQREVIAEILVQIDDERQLDVLLEQLAPGERMLRDFILRALAQIKITVPVVKLAGLLRSPHEDVRYFSKKMLIAQGGREAFRLLQGQILEGTWPSRKEAIDVLVVLGKEAAAPVLAKLMDVVPRYLLKQIVDYLSGFDTGVALKALENVLLDKDPAIRLTALRALKRSQSPRLVDLLISLFEDSNKGLRKEAILFLARIKDKKLTLPFIACLEDRDYDIKIAAVRTLGELGALAAFEPLLLTTTAGDENLEKEVFLALNKLSRIDDAAIVESVIKIVRTGNEAARKKAIFFLSTQENEDIIRMFLGHLMESEWWVRDRVISCLGDIRSAAFDRVIMDCLEANIDEMRGFALTVVGKLRKREAVDIIIKTLDKYDQFMQDRVITALGEIGDKKAAPFLTKCLKIEESRWSAAEALGRLGDPGSFEALVEVWPQSSREEKVTIADALCRVDSSKAAEYLKQFLFDDDPLLRTKIKELITWTIAKELKADSIENLSCLLLSPDRPAGICQRLVTAVKNKPFDIVGAVINMLASESPDICGEFAGCLVSVVGASRIKEIMSFISSLDVVTRNRILGHLLGHKNQAFKDVIIDFLHRGNMPEKYLAVEVVRHTNFSEAVPGLIKILPEADLSMKELIFQALKTLGGEQVIEEMIRQLESPDFRWQASDVLAHLCSPKAVNALVKAADDPRPEVIIAVMEALIKIGGPGVKKKIRELTHHETRRVSIRALEALEILGREKDLERRTLAELVEFALSDRAGKNENIIAQLKAQPLQELGFMDMLVRTVEAQHNPPGAEKVLILLSRMGIKEITTGFLLRISKLDENSRQDVITAVDKIRDPVVIEVIVDIIAGGKNKLKEEEFEMFLNYMITIARKARLAEAVPSLLTILDQSGWMRRNYVIEALGIIGDQRGVTPVLKYLEDPDSMWTVIEALGEMKDETAAGKIIAAMDKDTPDILIAAIKSLVKIGYTGAVSKIKEYRYDKNIKIRLTAIEAINKLQLVC